MTDNLHRTQTRDSIRAFVDRINSTAADYPRTKCIHHLFEEQAIRTPDATAVVFEEQTLSYAQLNEQANQLAHYLRRHGVGPDTPVGICMDRSLELMVSLLGILKAGGAYVPLDPKYPAERLNLILRDTAATILITQSHLQRLFHPAIESFCTDIHWANLGTLPTSNPAIEQNSDSLAYIIFTSGSTGTPKGVEITHRSLVNYIRYAESAYVRGEILTFVLFTSLAFDLTVTSIYTPIISGGSIIVVAPSKEFLLHDILMDSRVGIIKMTPSHLAILRDFDFSQSKVRRMIVGGEALDSSLCRDIYKHGGQHIEIYNEYGPTETTVGSVVYLFNPADSYPNVLIGRPIFNTQIHILNEQMEPVPPGTTGELYIGGDGLARGYYNRPELTRERFVPNPFAQASERLYKTGDLCRYMEDGNLDFLGRKDFQIKIRGFRIELGEIEAAIQSLPGICQAVVTAHGEGDNKALAAYATLSSESNLVPDAIRHFLIQKLPGYMVPSAIAILDKMPLTTNGKVDRTALPGPEFHSSGTDYVRPETNTERQLEIIWARLLKQINISRTDNFFALGGHSLLAIQMTYQAQESLGRRISPTTVFEYPVLKDFACQIDQMQTISPANKGVIPSASRHKMLPLSFAQNRMWFSQQVSPDRAVYNVPFLITFDGHLDITRLEQSLRTIICRHESFRTTVSFHNGELVQVIHADMPWTFRKINIEQNSGETSEKSFHRIAATESTFCFDLEKGPLFDFALYTADALCHALFINMHHLITDAWSMGLFLDELSALYRSENSQSPVLPNTSLQYADYSDWQRSQIETFKAQDFPYWKNTLGTDLSETTIPCDFPRPQTQTWDGDWEFYQINPNLYKKLLTFCSGQQCTLFTTLLSAFMILLYRYTGNQTPILGSPIAGRTQKDTEHIIGFFVNIVLLKSLIKPDSDFICFLKEIKDTCLKAQLHQNLPYDVLVDMLNFKRGTNYNQLFQILFVYQDARYWKLNLPGLKTRTSEIGTSTSKMDATLFAEENEEGLTLRLEYNTDLYHRKTIQRLLQHFEHLLEVIVEKPNQTISTIPFQLKSEIQRLADWNNTARKYPKNQCIHELFEEQAIRTPEATAVVFEEQTLSYAQLNEQANQLAHYLRQQGVGPDTPVGICMDRSLELMVALLGILKAGGAYVPLDPLYPAQRLHFMIQDTGLHFILTQRHLAETLPQDVTLLIWESLKPELADIDLTNLQNQTQARNLAYIIFTSGSTGTPKGVAVPHRGVVRLVFGQDYLDFGPTRRFLQLAPVSFDASTLEIWGPLLHGGTCVLYPGRTPEIDSLGQILAVHKINTLWLTASLFNMVIDEDPEILKSVGTVLTGGEALSVYHIQKALQCLENTQLVNGYGPTESTTFTCCYRIPKQLPDKIASIPIGKPIANTQVYIVDSTLQPVPVGIWGELYIGGDGLAQGYINRPDLTSERFIQNPFDPDPTSRLYKTGDICRWLDDGTIEFGGRADDQVKIRGFRIELGEIEAVLRSHPSVQQAAVMVRQDIPGQKYLAGYIVLDNNQPVSMPTLHSWLAEKLPDYLVPTAIVEVPQLPLTASGKIDRQKLPKPTGQHLKIGGTKPETPAEKTLAKLWKEVLGVDQVDMEDNFFHLGGHSLLAAKLFYQIQEQFQINLPLSIIFESPTLGQLANQLKQQKTVAVTKDIVLIKSGSHKRAIFYLPGVGGHTLTFYHLAHSINIPLTQYGLNMPGLNGHLEPCETIEELAAYFISLMRSVQPEGPYYICGFSMGGQVAYEVAMQLSSQGQKVAFLCVLGTSAPNMYKDHEWKPARYMDRFLRFCRVSIKDKVAYFKMRQNEIRMKKQKQVSKEDFINIRNFPRYQYIYQLGLKAFYRYKPQGQFSGSMVLFREMKDPCPLDRDMYDDPTFGWVRAVTGSVRVYDIDCTHPNILNQPHVKQCALSLQQEIMDAIDAEGAA